MKKVLALTILGLFLVAGNAMALNIRPVTIEDGAGSEPSLQDVFNTAITTGTLSAANDQSEVALWTRDEGSMDAYLISMFTSASGTLGIYSASNPTQLVDLAVFTAPGVPAAGGGSPASVAFDIDLDGNVYVNNSDTGLQLDGGAFGFYWKVNNSIYYTEDSKNGGVARGLAYQLDEGTVVNQNAYGVYNQTFTAKDNNDWLLAWEDWTDNDFQDAIFVLEDLKAVPEPGTVLLLGVGLLGLIGLGRKRIKK